MYSVNKGMMNPDEKQNFRNTPLSIYYYNYKLYAVATLSCTTNQYVRSHSSPFQEVLLSVVVVSMVRSWFNIIICIRPMAPTY